MLASACLPQMYKAVEIGGEAYWDGGFSANPALFPLVTNTASPDILIVQINPFHRPALPRTARDIINRVNEISFNTSLVKELRTLALVRRARCAGRRSCEAAGVGAGSTCTWCTWTRRCRTSRRRASSTPSGGI